MNPSTFDTLVRRLATTPSRRAVLGALAGALAAALGREPASAQTCTGFPCKNDLARCTASGSTCCCCRYPGYHSCLDRRECQGTGGVCVAATTTTTTTTTTPAPCGGSVCPQGCSCAPLLVGGEACTTGTGSGQECSLSQPCPAGEDCFLTGGSVSGGTCQATCEPVAQARASLPAVPAPHRARLSSTRARRRHAPPDRATS
jgi:hypothetical protein